METPIADVTNLANAPILSASQSFTIAASPTGATESGTTVTITTTTAHNLVAGESVTIAGVGVTGYNGTFTIVSVPTTNTFTYTDTAGLAASGGGTVTTPNVTVTTSVPNDFTVGQMVTITGLTPSAFNGTFKVVAVLNPTTFTYSNPTSGLTATTTVGNATVTSDVLDLAGNFSDPDIQNSEVEIDTNFGAIDVNLDDTTAPQTVANFYDYINSGEYNNTIFHRLVSGFVLQGGGFALQTNPSSLTAVNTFPDVPNEFGPQTRSAPSPWPNRVPTRIAPPANSSSTWEITRAIWTTRTAASPSSARSPTRPASRWSMPWRP